MISAKYNMELYFRKNFSITLDRFIVAKCAIKFLTHLSTDLSTAGNQVSIKPPIVSFSPSSADWGQQQMGAYRLLIGGESSQFMTSCNKVLKWPFKALSCSTAILKKCVSMLCMVSLNKKLYGPRLSRKNFNRDRGRHRTYLPTVGIICSER